MVLQIFLYTLLILFLSALLFLYIKFRNPKYTFKGHYYYEKIGGHTSEILRFVGKYKQPKSQNYVIIAISGNPGVVHFYDKFLYNLHKNLNEELDIYCIGQIHHYEFKGKPKFQTHSLKQNLEHKQKFIEKLLDENPQRKFIFLSHSIGAYMSLYAMKKLQDSQIVKAYMMFPTVFAMNDSPSGISNRWFYPKSMHYVTALVIGVFNTIVPDFILRAIMTYLRREDEDVQECIIRMLSFSNALNAFTLGRNEMDLVKDIDHDLISEKLHKCFYYFGTTDGWVPMEYVDKLTKTFAKMNYKIDEHKIAHAFVCGYSEKQAQIKAEYLKQDLPHLNDL